MKRRENNEFSLKQAMDHMVDKKGLRNGMDQLEIEAAWDKVCAGLIAKHTQSLTFRRNKLWVKVDSSPLKQELSYMKAELIVNLNEYLGKELVNAIVIE